MWTFAICGPQSAIVLHGHGLLLARDHVPLVAALETFAEFAARLRALRLGALEPALGASLGDWAIPGDEVAVGVVRAPEEDLAAAGTALGEIAAVLRAFDAERDR